MPTIVGGSSADKAESLPKGRVIGHDQLQQVRQPRPMLGRLPWLALERRSLALRFLVFLDIGARS